MISLTSDNKNKLTKICKKLDISDADIDILLNAIEFEKITKISDVLSIRADLLSKELYNKLNYYDLSNLDIEQTSRIDIATNLQEQYNKITLHPNDDRFITVLNKCLKPLFYEDVANLCNNVLLVPFSIFFHVICSLYDGDYNNSVLKEPELVNLINDFYKVYDIDKEELNTIVNILKDVDINDSNSITYVLSYNCYKYELICNTLMNKKVDIINITDYKIHSIAYKIFELICYESPYDKTHSELFNKYILSNINGNPKDIIKNLKFKKKNKNDFELNVINNRHIIDFCKKHGFNKIIFISVMIKILYFKDDNIKYICYHFISTINDFIEIAKYGYYYDRNHIFNHKKDDKELEPELKIDYSDIKKDPCKYYNDKQYKNEFIFIYFHLLGLKYSFSKDSLPKAIQNEALKVESKDNQTEALKNAISDINISLLDENELKTELKDFKIILDSYLKELHDIHLKSVVYDNHEVYDLINEYKDKLLKNFKKAADDNYEKLYQMVDNNSIEDVNKQFVIDNVNKTFKDMDIDFNPMDTYKSIIDKYETTTLKNIRFSIDTYLYGFVDKIISQRKYVNDEKDDKKMSEYFVSFLTYYSTDKILLEYYIAKFLDILFKIIQEDTNDDKQKYITNIYSKVNIIKNLCKLLSEYALLYIQHFGKEGICSLLSRRYIKNCLELNKCKTYMSNIKDKLNDYELKSIYNNKLKINSNGDFYNEYYKLYKDIFNYSQLPIHLNDELLEANSIDDMKADTNKLINSILYEVPSYSYLYYKDNDPELDAILYINSFIKANNELIKYNKYNSDRNEYNRHFDLIKFSANGFYEYIKLDDNIIESIKKQLIDNNVIDPKYVNNIKNIKVDVEKQTMIIFKLYELMTTVEVIKSIYETTYDDDKEAIKNKLLKIITEKSDDKPSKDNIKDEKIYDLLYTIYTLYISLYYKNENRSYIENSRGSIYSVFDKFNNIYTKIQGRDIKDEYKKQAEIYRELIDHDIYYRNYRTDISVMLEFYKCFVKEFYDKIMKIDTFNNNKYISNPYSFINIEHSNVTISTDLLNLLKKTKLNECTDNYKEIQYKTIIEYLLLLTYNKIFEDALIKYLKNNPNKVYPSYISTNIDNIGVNHAMCISYSLKDDKLVRNIHDPNILLLNNDNTHIINFIPYECYEDNIKSDDDYITKHYKTLTNSLKLIHGGYNKSIFKKVLLIILIVSLIIIIVSVICVCTKYKTFNNAFQVSIY